MVKSLLDTKTQELHVVLLCRGRHKRKNKEEFQKGRGTSVVVHADERTRENWVHGQSGVQTKTVSQKHQDWGYDQW